MKAIPPQMLRNPTHLLSLGFGSGLAPKAPGTFGTFAAIPFWFLLQLLPTSSYIAAPLICWAITTIFEWTDDKVNGNHVLDHMQ